MDSQHHDNRIQSNSAKNYDIKCMLHNQNQNFFLFQLHERRGGKHNR